MSLKKRSSLNVLINCTTTFGQHVLNQFCRRGHVLLCSKSLPVQFNRIVGSQSVPYKCESSYETLLCTAPAAATKASIHQSRHFVRSHSSCAARKARHWGPNIDQESAPWILSWSKKLPEPPLPPITLFLSVSLSLSSISLYAASASPCAFPRHPLHPMQSETHRWAAPDGRIGGECDPWAVRRHEWMTGAAVWPQGFTAAQTDRDGAVCGFVSDAGPLCFG